MLPIIAFILQQMIADQYLVIFFRIVSRHANCSLQDVNCGKCDRLYLTGGNNPHQALKAGETLIGIYNHNNQLSRTADVKDPADLI